MNIIDTMLIKRKFQEVFQQNVSQ